MFIRPWIYCGADRLSCCCDCLHVQFTSHKTILAGTAGLLLLGVPGSTATTLLKTSSIRVVCSRQVHQVNAFRMGSRNLPIAMKSFTCICHVSGKDCLLVCEQCSQSYYQSKGNDQHSKQHNLVFEGVGLGEKVQQYWVKWWRETFPALSSCCQKSNFVHHSLRLFPD
jgi:hypothetical protein